MRRYIELKNQRSPLARIGWLLVVIVVAVALFGEPTETGRLARAVFGAIASFAEGLVSFLSELGSRA